MDNLPSPAASRPVRRIAHIVESLATGGLERLVVDLACAQKARGHDVTIFCVCAAGPLAQVAETAGVPVHSFGKPPGFSLRAVLDVAAALRRRRIQCVHTHNAIIHHYGAAAGRLAGARATINTQHGIGAVTHSPRQRRLFRLVMPITDCVVFVSEDACRAFHHQGIHPRRSRVILNGIDLSRLLARQATPGAQPGRVRFGTVGRLTAVKDHATLIRAFHRLRQDLPGAQLTILGQGPLHEELQQLTASLGLDEEVRFLPGDADVPAFLSSLDAFVLSSLTEGLPLCVLEAMATGLPVVSTRVGGVPEAAPEGDVAFYCPPEDPAALAAAMHRMAVDGRMAGMGRTARDYVQAHFGIEAMVQGYDNLMEQLLS